MTSLPQSGGAEPFFLQTDLGQRFCLFHPPVRSACRGVMLYVPPFGDEMNKARRMAAMQARALAALGYGVLQLDLYGCGDSSGEFSQARWAIWKDDVHAACAWLAARYPDAPLTLWGLRLGCLLALDCAAGAPVPPARLVLWQPQHNGSAFLTQFLRLLSANEMLADSGDKPKSSAAALKSALLGGQLLEVAGYELAPALAQAIDALDGAALAPLHARVDWFDVAASLERPLAPALERQVNGWREQGVDLHMHRVAGAAFWSTQEITDAPALIAATLALFEPGQS